ncbi:MAG: hypothetical protein KME18_00735 [Phormidium tanganyikae FI6-MK23]|jgi:hypothetical protein|nr:hypothetical protein [Phormidium tanganyikae FI6-MK23]
MYRFRQGWIVSKRMGLILVGLIGLSVGLLALSKLQSRRPSIASGCPDWVLSQTENSPETIHPEDLVIEPWYGRHNVFATFKIPDGYQPSPFFVVSLKGSNPYCGQILSRSKTGSDQRVTGVFRTRTTLWLMLRGHLDQLKQPTNWKLTISKESP